MTLRARPVSTLHCILLVLYLAMLSGYICSLTLPWFKNLEFVLDGNAVAGREVVKTIELSSFSSKATGFGYFMSQFSGAVQIVNIVLVVFSTYVTFPGEWYHKFPRSSCIILALALIVLQLILTVVAIVLYASHIDYELEEDGHDLSRGRWGWAMGSISALFTGLLQIGAIIVCVLIHHRIRSSYLEFHLES